ncbi:MAG: zinc ribbon domain-containing protein [Thermodesulfobacteriota bacterium]
MPIYEFRCLACNEMFELLCRSTDDKVDLACPKCGAENIERVLSVTNHAVSDGSGRPTASAQTRTCGSGSCTTWNIPGHSK